MPETTGSHFHWSI